MDDDASVKARQTLNGIEFLCHERLFLPALPSEARLQRAELEAIAAIVELQACSQVKLWRVAAASSATKAIFVAPSKADGGPACPRLIKVFTESGCVHVDVSLKLHTLRDLSLDIASYELIFQELLPCSEDVPSVRTVLEAACCMQQRLGKANFEKDDILSLANSADVVPQAVLRPFRPFSWPDLASPLTVAAPGLSKTSGKWYFEFALGVGAISQRTSPLVGFMSSDYLAGPVAPPIQNFNTNGINFGRGLKVFGEGAIGLDAFSWAGCIYSDWEPGAYCKHSFRRMHNGMFNDYEASGPLTEGDVIGVAIDLDSGGMKFSHNGKWQNTSNAWSSRGDAYYFPCSGRAVFPAATLVGNFSFRFSAPSFSFMPPDPSYQPLMTSDSGDEAYCRPASTRDLEAEVVPTESEGAVDDLWRSVELGESQLFLSPRRRLRLSAAVIAVGDRVQSKTDSRTGIAVSVRPFDPITAAMDSCKDDLSSPSTVDAPVDVSDVSGELQEAVSRAFENTVPGSFLFGRVNGNFQNVLLKVIKEADRLQRTLPKSEEIDAVSVVWDDVAAASGGSVMDKPTDVCQASRLEILDCAPVLAVGDKVRSKADRKHGTVAHIATNGVPMVKLDQEPGLHTGSFELVVPSRMLCHPTIQEFLSASRIWTAFLSGARVPSWLMDRCSASAFGTCQFVAALADGHKEVPRPQLSEMAFQDLTCMLHVVTKPSILHDQGQHTRDAWAIRTFLDWKADPNLVVEPDVTEFAMLHDALEARDDQTVRMLLNLKADINARAHRDYTPSVLPLHFAALFGQMEAAKMLLEQQADPKTADGRDKLPFHYAMQGGNAAVVRLFLEMGTDVNGPLEHDPPEDEDAILVAAQAGNVEVLQTLLDARCNASHGETGKRSALHEAAYKGNIEACSLLLDYGADLTVKDYTERSPEECAKWCKHDTLHIFLSELRMWSENHGTGGKLGQLRVLQCSFEATGPDMITCKPVTLSGEEQELVALTRDAQVETLRAMLSSRLSVHKYWLRLLDLDGRILQDSDLIKTSS